MFSTFEKTIIHANGVDILVAKGGSGPPLLLLHGYPQTHMMWHKVADELAEHFTVVATDLRGYGDSSKPDGLEDHSNYAKRELARDQVEVMKQLGFDSFYVVGHDRGARVAYRMALDHPERVKKLVILDIVPTLLMYEQTDMDFAKAYYHWFFLIQPSPLPEQMISNSLSLYLDSALFGSGRSKPLVESPFSKEAYEDYLRCMQLPNGVHAKCEDYRAGATIDLVHDRADLEAGKKIACEVLVLWGENGVIEKQFNPLSDWAKFASNVQGHSVPCGHFIPEEAPELVASKLIAFFGACPPTC